MIRVLGWALLFLALCMVTAWTIASPFPLHFLVALVAVVGTFAAFFRALIVLAHVVNRSGGL